MQYVGEGKDRILFRDREKSLKFIDVTLQNKYYSALIHIRNPKPVKKYKDIYKAK